MKKNFSDFLNGSKSLKEFAQDGPMPGGESEQDPGAVMSKIMEKLSGSGGLSAFIDEPEEIDEEASQEYLNIMNIYKIMRKVNPKKAQELFDKAMEIKSKGKIDPGAFEGLM